MLLFQMFNAQTLHGTAIYAAPLTPKTTPMECLGCVPFGSHDPAAGSVGMLLLVQASEVARK